MRANRLILTALLMLTALGAQAQQRFPSPEAAGEALLAALGTERADPQRLVALLGDDWRQFIPEGSVEREDVDAFIALYREAHSYPRDEQGNALLLVGRTPWSFPLPLVRSEQGWHFDSRAGGEEMRTRRIGRNELAVQQALLAYHDAQMDYAAEDRDGDGVLEYAQRFMSSDGQYDGLYWPAEPGIEESPLGPLFGDELPDGQWQGYHYRILTAQGASAPGGAYDYRLGANMSRGFALVAWPAEYGDSGVMSFMISHDGQLFERNLGPQGEALAGAMTGFDPDSGWQEVEPQPEP